MLVSKRFLIIWGICIALVLAGCGQAQPENTPADQSATEKTDTPSIKSEAEIKGDLAENQDFYTLFDYNCYDSYGNYADSAYSIDELTITRRKTDKDAGTDDIYAAITASSPDSKYVGDFHLLYSLYDVGGWYLENIELESGTLEALSQVSEADAFNIVLNLLAPLGADPADSWIDHREMISDREEIITAVVDFDDGIISVFGSIELYFYYDGTEWSHEQTSTDLAYDILADGTYESLGHTGYPDFLVISHENGVPVVRRTSGWGGGIDPFKVKDWEFDCLSRAYIYGGGVNGDIPCEYRFGDDGNIYYFINGVQDKTLYRIADPITDADVLWEALKQSGNSW
ncbi:MAG: hypothetical protein HFF38_05765 [Lawsonibacter sp.]|nr:hypothetical protein [Lawsonibacter sp.]